MSLKLVSRAVDGGKKDDILNLNLCRECFKHYSKHWTRGNLIPPHFLAAIRWLNIANAAGVLIASKPVLGWKRNLTSIFHPDAEVIWEGHGEKSQVQLRAIINQVGWRGWGPLHP